MGKIKDFYNKFQEKRYFYRDNLYTCSFYVTGLAGVVALACKDLKTADNMFEISILSALGWRITTDECDMERTKKRTHIFRKNLGLKI